MDPNVSIEEQTKALEFCGKHLSGAWKHVTLSEVKICKLSGGMSNLLYFCALSDDIETHNEEPRQVLLRLYGPLHGDTELQLEIFNQLAAENLGPTLYGTFHSGRLEEYLPSNPLTWIELTSSSVSAVVARKIAAIHKLNVKNAKKESNWLLDKYNHYNDFIVDVKTKSLSIQENTLDSTKAIALNFEEVDFKPEIEYMQKLFQNSNAPLVFSHNDLHQNNILLLHKKHDFDEDHLDDRIVLIDFEYCSYNYRTFDLANYLSEWCFDYSGDTYPHFNFSLDRFPTEQNQRHVLGHYIDHASNLEDLTRVRSNLSSNSNGKTDPNDKIDTLYNEMQPFLMASNLLWTLWAIYSAHTSKIKFGYWEMAKSKWDVYLLCKARFNNRLVANSRCDGDILMQSPKM